MWTFEQECAALSKSKSAVSRARRDPAHPAYRPTPASPTLDPRCDTITMTGRGGARLVTRAPEDAVRAFWAGRRPGPKSATPDQPLQETSTDA